MTEPAKIGTATVERNAHCQDELFHICAEHVYVTSPPCGPDCSSFCGQKWEGGAESAVEGSVLGVLCVVCDEMSR